MLDPIYIFSDSRQ